jgi:hypothetical protein
LVLGKIELKGRQAQEDIDTSMNIYNRSSHKTKNQTTNKRTNETNMDTLNMFRFTCITLFVSTISVYATDTTAVSNLRGSSGVISSSTRFLQSNNDTSVLCRVTTFDTMYYDDDANIDEVDMKDTYTKEQVTCLPIVNNIELEYEIPIALPEAMVQQYKNDIQMGILLVQITDASFVYNSIDINDIDDIMIGDASQYIVVNATQHNRHLLERHLLVKPVMTVAVIRISASDVQPTTSRTQLQSTLFSTTGINFMTQYKAVSFGKLQWSLAASGVVDIQVPNTVASYGTATALVTAAQKQIKTKYQITEVSAMADKIVMCLPAGTGSWAASAGVNHWRAQFNNDWCTSLSGTMHELGHTLGLLHAQANGVEYADRTGYMGSGYTSSTFPRKAFDGYNLWKFGWYSDRHFILYPSSDGDRLVKLASFVDYKSTATDEYVVISVNDQYYLVYNTNKGFNIETEQKQNQVTVTEALSIGTNNLAGLSPGGDKFSVANYQGSGKTLIIEACKSMSGANGAAVMQVSIALGKSLCGTNVVNSRTYQDSTTTNSGGRTAFLAWLDKVFNSVRSKVIGSV